MTANAEQLRVKVLALPEADRLELAHLLLDSVEPPVSEEEKAFDAELERRAQEIRSGQVTGLTKEKLFARLDARLTALR